ncbi:hypothetical protein VFPBJ_11568 [Purpureocillium lilacinum]|uniref:Uncharacterized protein n=1 Tax=Purpureocillium lilacinum TaxID=33203 RepID=A0A179F4P3_PURLI|nr:hypothetical protein VFPBJ_11568 [Purpureocillium lilacinum]
MMIERALLKQSELNSFVQDLGLEADALKRVPPADVLTSDDWKVLREVRHILEPIYHMTMRTQGWGTGSGHGRLGEVMAGMEFILDHLENWRATMKIGFLIRESQPESIARNAESEAERPSRHIRLQQGLLLYCIQHTVAPKIKNGSSTPHAKIVQLFFVRCPRQTQKCCTVV